MPDPTDQPLRAQMHALRDHDLRQVPEFDSVCSAALQRRRGSRPALGRRAAWAGVACGLALGLAWRLGPLDAQNPKDPQPPLDSLALPAWRTPTAGLLVGAVTGFQASRSPTLPTDVLGRSPLPRFQENR